MERKFHGKTRAEMNGVLDYMCLLKERLRIPAEEQDKFDMAIQCIATVTNRMTDDKKIEWD